MQRTGWLLRTWLCVPVLWVLFFSIAIETTSLLAGLGPASSGLEWQGWLWETLTCLGCQEVWGSHIFSSWPCPWQ